MIVRNEEKNLPRVLRSVEGLVDEIVIVDTGSTDRTVEVAISSGARVEHFAWCDDFSAARNHALSFAREDWILVLDADDEFERADIPDARRLLASTKVDVITVRQEITWPGAASFVKVQPSFFRRRANIRYSFRVHEAPNLTRVLVGHSPLRSRHLGYTPDRMPEKESRNQRLLQLMKGDPDPIHRIAASYYLGSLYEAMSRANDAWKEFVQGTYLLESAPFRLNCALGLARVAMEQGDLAFSRALLDSVVEANPGAFESELLLAELSLREGQGDEARTHAAKAKKAFLMLTGIQNAPWERQVRLRLSGLLGEVEA